MRALPIIVLAACAGRSPSPAPSGPEHQGLAFAGLALPASDVEGADVRVSPMWTLDDRRGPVRLQVLAGSGARIGDTVFGALVDAQGEPLPDPVTGLTPSLPPAIDFNALHPTPAGLVMLSHVEARPAALYKTTLDLADDGTLTPTGTHAIDLTPVHGSKDLCAGDVTPWGTHLGGEEYDVDAAGVGADGLVVDPDRYEREYNAMGPVLAPGLGVWPYDYGWMLEVDPVTGTPAKRHAMGRFSHELGIVMPDRRTVLLSDDRQVRGALLLFVADRADDLSAGTLYAWKATPPQGPGDLLSSTWVSLGHASEADLAQVMAARSLRFHDVFRAEDRTGDRCPDGLTDVHHALGRECLAVQPGMESVASRLETRRWAAMRGATVEISKGEGLAYDPDTHTAYLAISQLDAAMSDGEGDLDLPPSPCGAIWALHGFATDAHDTDGAPIDSAFVPTRVREVLRGRALDSERCDPDAIAHPDNVAVLPGHRQLVIAEDTLAHTFPTLWAMETDTGRLVRLATAPWCAEWSGLHGYADLSGHAWLTVSLQHAWQYKGCAAPEGLAMPPAQERTWTGVIGPLPRPDR